MLENTEGAIKKGNPEKLATQDTQDTGQKQSRETGNIQGTQDEEKQNKNTRETGNIQGTQDEEKQNKNTEKLATYRVHKTKRNKAKTQHNMSCTPLYANKHK